MFGLNDSGGISNAIDNVLDRVSVGLTGPLRTFSDLSSLTSLSTAFGPMKHVLFNMYARRDPLMSYSWFAEMPKVGNVALDWNYVEEFTAPFRSFDTLPQYREGRMYHFAGQHSISNLSIRFYDDTSGKVGMYLENWRRAVMSNNGTYNYAQDYKKIISLTILDVSRLITVYQIKYIGCWPSSAEPYNLNSGASDRITPSQEFNVDDIEITIRNMEAQGLLTAIGDKVKDFPQNLISKLNGTDPLVALGGQFNSNDS